MDNENVIIILSAELSLGFTFMAEGSRRGACLRIEGVVKP